MRNPKSAEVMRISTGGGEITFPRGGRIQTRFKLAEHADGQAILTCEGMFTQASYRGWEQLVHQYRLGPGLPRHRAQQSGLVQTFAGRTTEDQALTVLRMLLISAEAWGVDGDNLRLQMQFECLELTLQPLPPALEPATPAVRHAP